MDTENPVRKDGFGGTGFLLGAATAGFLTAVSLTLLCIELFPSSNLAPIIAWIAAPVMAIPGGLLGTWIGVAKNTYVPKVLSIVLLTVGLVATAVYFVRDLRRLPEDSRGYSLLTALMAALGAAGLVVIWRKRNDPA